MSMHRFLMTATAVMISLLGGAAPLAQAALLDDLVVYYDFEDATFQNKAPGFAGQYLPTVTGSPTSGYAGTTPGRTTLLAGKAMNINDTSGVITASANLDQIRVQLGSGPLAVAPGSNLGTAFSISAWSYLAPTVLNRSDRFYVFEPNNSFDISWGTSPASTGPDAYAAYNNQVIVPLSPAASFARQTWHHTLHTFEPGVAVDSLLLKVYVDGELRGSLEQPYANFSFQNINFGNARDGTNRAWDGLLDEIAIWDRPLSAAEVGTVYATGLAGQSLLNPVPEPSTWALGGMMLAGFAAIARRRGIKS